MEEMEIGERISRAIRLKEWNELTNDFYDIYL
jgi:hypothetical protein